MIDIRKANRWAWPRVSYINYRKHFPGVISANCFTKLFAFRRAWGGRIWVFTCRHHDFFFDFRHCRLSDMAFPEANRKDRDAVSSALEAAKGGGE